MKLIFLHGLGQTGQAWEQVIAAFPTQECVALNLFETNHLPENLSDLRDRVVAEIEASHQEVILVGLSLGAMLALSVLEKDLPQLKGVVAVAGQYKMTDNWAYKLQLRLFSLFPRWLFKKQGMDKDNLLVFYRNLAEFDLTAHLRACDTPVLLLCGDKDKVNHKASREMETLLEDTRFELLTGAGHEVNKDQPVLLARHIEQFIKEC